jgi:site-specific DNA recombinase
VGTRVGVYCRISDDRAGAGLGVQRQQADCRRLAALRGWSVVEVFSDNDLSAYFGKRRPGYRRLLDALHGGELDAVVAWHADRLHRSPVELEEFIAVCDERRVLVETVQAGTVDLSTPSGRMVARMLGSAARYESEHKAERIKRKAQELAQAGKVGGGGTRPFGYEADRRTLRESEAAVVRDLAARFLAGESLGSLTRWLNEAGMPSVVGRGWSIQTVRRLLMSGRISGQREHHGQIVAPAEWPAIITPEQTARIRAVLADPARRTTRTARRYLLAGMLRCHRCGTIMVARPREDGSRRYVCPGPPHPRGCGGTYVLADPVEQWLVEAVLYRLDSPYLADAVAGRATGDETAEAAQQQIKQARARLNDLAEMFGAGEITRAEYVTARKRAEEQVKGAEKTLGALTQTSVLDGHLGNGAALREQWASLNLDRQRAIVRTLLDYATVGPAVRGRNTFDPGRITPEWRL